MCFSSSILAIYKTYQFYTHKNSTFGSLLIVADIIIIKGHVAAQLHYEKHLTRSVVLLYSQHSTHGTSFR